jgi:predicted GNAT superfamily acetyltransferase
VPFWPDFYSSLPDRMMTTPNAFPSLHFRPFSTREDYDACTAFQEEVWGEGFSERVSGAVLMIANRIGGLSAGAFDEDGALQGFVFGMTGLQEGSLVHWSDMLAVRSHLRDQGLGSRLKHYQREVLLDSGISIMHWTFDPLQSRNAYVNFAKLGILSREYVRDMYGETGSPLHGGLGTDRLVATWEMDSDRVRRRIARKSPTPLKERWKRYPWALEGRVTGILPLPSPPDLTLEAPAVLVSIPREIEGIMAQDPELALQWREATREVFLAYLDRGYEVWEIFPDDQLSHYLLIQSGEEVGEEKSDSKRSVE